jgi:glycosyltransferase involved in cell wall biosynthesis
VSADQEVIIIYRDHLLYPSETFVRAQANALKRHFPVFAGLRRVPGLELPEEQTRVIGSGHGVSRIREVAFKLWGVAPGFVKELRSLQPRLIHAHFGADGLRAMPLAKELNVPLIVSFHGSDATVTKVGSAKTPFGHRHYLKNKVRLQAGASQIIAVSEFVKAKLLEQGYRDEQVRVHYIGVDTKLFSPSSAEAEPFVLFAGRLVDRKGVGYLIRAMAEVQADMPSLGLVVIGEGPKRQELEALGKTMLRKVRFVGKQPPEAVRDWMARCAIFAAPSIRVESGEEEGFGIVLIEAQAMEKPVVSFNSGGIGEAVEHGVTGFLGPERDVQVLAHNIALLARDPYLRLRAGVAGRIRTLQLFDLEKQTAKLEAIYGEVTSRFFAGCKRRESIPNGASLWSR